MTGLSGKLGTWKPRQLTPAQRAHQAKATAAARELYALEVCSVAECGRHGSFGFGPRATGLAAKVYLCHGHWKAREARLEREARAEGRPWPPYEQAPPAPPELRPNAAKALAVWKAWASR